MRTDWSLWTSWRKKKEKKKGMVLSELNTLHMYTDSSLSVNREFWKEENQNHCVENLYFHKQDLSKGLWAVKMFDDIMWHHVSCIVIRPIGPDWRNPVRTFYTPSALISYKLSSCIVEKKCKASVTGSFISWDLCLWRQWPDCWHQVLVLFWSLDFKRVSRHPPHRSRNFSFCVKVRVRYICQWSE